MEGRILRHAEAQQAGTPAQRRALQRLCYDVQGRGAGAFPCYFAVRALARDELRYCFLNGTAAGDMDRLARALETYLEQAPAIGRVTSLIVFMGEGPQQPSALDEYRRCFWRVLRALRRRDPAPWPDDIPTDPEDPSWEFCFAGTPLFVVCNTPSHEARRSRYAETLTLTFQPRWVFDGIEGHTTAGQVARRHIRQRLEAYDEVAPSPDLGNYGSHGNREWTQYFLDDANEPAASEARCPLRGGAAKEARLA